jgi:hypothetical protein
MAKHKFSKEDKAKESKAEAKAMPAGTAEAPGPINHPHDHPAHNLPPATDDYDGDELPPMITGAM